MRATEAGLEASPASTGVPLIPLPDFLFNLTSCPHNSEPPKVLTAMDKMVQQIATINNLLIFINIQISQLQKSNEGRAPGEGPGMA